MLVCMIQLCCVGMTPAQKQLSTMTPPDSAHWQGDYACSRCSAPQLRVPGPLVHSAEPLSSQCSAPRLTVPSPSAHSAQPLSSQCRAPQLTFYSRCSTPVVHWAHKMKAHWAKAHPTTVMPQDLERVLKRKINIDGVDDGVSEIELFLRCSWVLLN
jgi:hypothetical protein